MRIRVEWIPRRPSARGIVGVLRRRVSRSINKGVKDGYAYARRRMKKRTTARVRTFNKRSGTVTSKPRNLKGVLWIGGDPMQSSSFKSVDRYPNGVDVYIYRASPTRFPHAFVSRRGGRGKGSYKRVWQREGRERKPLFDPVLEKRIGFAKILLPQRSAIATEIKVSFEEEFDNQ